LGWSALTQPAGGRTNWLGKKIVTARTLIRPAKRLPCGHFPICQSAISFISRGWRLLSNDYTSGWITSGLPALDQGPAHRWHHSGEENKHELVNGAPSPARSGLHTPVSRDPVQLLLWHRRTPSRSSSFQMLSHPPNYLFAPGILHLIV
jgi:hypothetical protein